MSSIGKDLALIRNHLGFSAEDIHQATKIPLTTIKSIEDGSLFENRDEIKTYVRSFVRSYGRALRLNEDDVVKALNQQEAGNYNQLLLKRFPELKDHIPAEPPQVEPDEPKSEQRKSAAPEKKESKKDFSSTDESDSPVAPPPGVRSVDWADMGKRFTATEKRAPVWLIGTILIISLVIGGAYLLYSNGVFNTESTANGPVIVQETPPPVEPEGNGTDLSLDFTDEPVEEETASTELDEILHLTIYAAHDKLEPVRVWSDEKPRMDPYWMNQGQAYNFEFQDTIRVRGQYSRMLLFLNGHRIENFRQDHYNTEEQAVELTRDLFEEDEPRWAAPIDLELPENVAMPDSVSERPQF